MVAIFAYIVHQNMNWQIFMEIFCLANFNKKVDSTAKKFRQKRFQYSLVSLSQQKFFNFVAYMS